MGRADYRNDNASDSHSGGTFPQTLAGNQLFLEFLGFCPVIMVNVERYFKVSHERRKIAGFARQLDYCATIVFQLAPGYMS
jgi:hypothetical protein